MIRAVTDYYDQATFDRMKAAADGLQTPVLIVDLETIRRHYQDLTTALPFADVFYAVKANPAVEVLTLLRDLGSSFDIASI